MGVNAIRNMLDVHNTALALVGSCHLQRLRSYSLKFMGFMTQRLDGDSGLRHPNVLEAQAADKALWQLIHDLVLDQQFSLDNAIHEVTHLRSDMASLLQPRPKIQTKSQSSFTPSMPTGSAKGRGKSKEKANKLAKRVILVLAPLGSLKLWFREASTTLYAISEQSVSERRFMQISTPVCTPISIRSGLRTGAQCI
jgi:hypothetical protein